MSAHNLNRSKCPNCFVDFIRVYFIVQCTRNTREIHASGVPCKVSSDRNSQVSAIIMDQGSRTKDPEDREEEEARGGIEHQRDNNEIINVLCTTSLPFHINVRSTIDDTYKLRERRRRSRRGIGYQQRNSNVNIVCSLLQLIATKYIRSSITLELNNGIAESKYYRKIRKEEKERSQRDRGKNHRQRDRVREVTLSELRDSIARLRERVKLVCRTRGSPPPRVHWLKDGVPLHPRRGLRIQHKRRRSKVVISSAKPEDSGKYECVAESTSGHRASLAAQLLVAHDTKIPETTTAAWPRQEQPCPMSGDFCMNGGTCLFFETVGEPACRCAEGFTGLRCETKDVISTGSVYNRRRVPFSCKLGLSTSYYC